MVCADSPHPSRPQSPLFQENRLVRALGEGLACIIIIVTWVVLWLHRFMKPTVI